MLAQAARRPDPAARCRATGTAARRSTTPSTRASAAAHHRPRRRRRAGQPRAARVGPRDRPDGGGRACWRPSGIDARTGAGQHVKLALEDVALAVMGHLGFIAEAAARRSGASGMATTCSARSARDFVSADGERVMVVGLTLKQWRALCEATGDRGRERSAGERARARSRRAKATAFAPRREIAELVGAWIAARPYRRGAATRSSATACAGAATRRSSSWSREDPACSEANPLFRAIEQPGVGRCSRRAPLRFSAVPRRHRDRRRGSASTPRKYCSTCCGSITPATVGSLTAALLRAELAAMAAKCQRDRSGSIVEARRPNRIGRNGRSSRLPGGVQSNGGRSGSLPLTRVIGSTVCSAVRVSADGQLSIPLSAPPPSRR